MESNKKAGLNRLKKILVIQQIVRQQMQDGKTMAWVHRTIIYPQYFITYGTLSRWMGVPAAKQIRDIEKNNEKD